MLSFNMHIKFNSKSYQRKIMSLLKEKHLTEKY